MENIANSYDEFIEKVSEGIRKTLNTEMGQELTEQLLRMKLTDTGIVTCSRCGEVLGNYMTGDYYKLIRIKYCDKCKGAVRREYKRFWDSQHRQANRELNKEMREQIRLLKEENERLRAERFGADTQMSSQRFKGL